MAQRVAPAATRDLILSLSKDEAKIWDDGAQGPHRVTKISTGLNAVPRLQSTRAKTCSSAARNFRQPPLAPS